jgi:hypothetical protein
LYPEGERCCLLLSVTGEEDKNLLGIKGPTWLRDQNGLAGAAGFVILLKLTRNFNDHAGLPEKRYKGTGVIRQKTENLFGNKLQVSVSALQPVSCPDDGYRSQYQDEPQAGSYMRIFESWDNIRRWHTAV